MTPQPSFSITSHTSSSIFYSALQPRTHIHPYYDHFTDRTRRICTIPASITSIPYLAFLDHHCSHITWKVGTTLEALQMATR